MGKERAKMWVSVQDCIGVPSFPQTAPNVRKKLESLVKPHPEMKRKKAGSKAFEYNVSILPEDTIRYFGFENLEDVASKRPLKDKNQCITNEELLDSYKRMWMFIFDNLSTEQKNKAITTFINGGLAALMPDVVRNIAKEEKIRDREIFPSNQSESFSYHISQSSINTAKILDKLTAEQRREILQRYGIDEEYSKDTINQPVSQHKKEDS